MHIILEFFAYIFVELIFEGLIKGGYRLLVNAFDFLRRKALGLPSKPLGKREQTEQKYLYKEIKLMEDINPKIKKGMKGVILEIVNSKTVFAEFLDDFGNQIEYEDELAFKVKINQFELIESDSID